MGWRGVVRGVEDNVQSSSMSNQLHIRVRLQPTSLSLSSWIGLAKCVRSWKWGSAKRLVSCHGRRRRVVFWPLIFLLSEMMCTLIVVTSISVVILVEQIVSERPPPPPPPPPPLFGWPQIHHLLHERTGRCHFIRHPKPGPSLPTSLMGQDFPASPDPINYNQFPSQPHLVVAGFSNSVTLVVPICHCLGSHCCHH